MTRPSRYDALAERLPALGRDPIAVRRRVEAMEHLLERMVTIPGLKRKVGLDVLLDILPGIGPVTAAALGGWMVWEARNLGMSRWQLARMAGNIGLDTLFSAVPVVGAIPDYFFRSNSRNLKIIRRHLDKHYPATVTIEQG